MRVLGCLVLISAASLVSAGVCAVSAAQPDPLAFRSTTRLVEISLVALDKRGMPVAGLTPQQLSVFDNGQPRAIAFFRWEGAPDRETNPVRVPPHIFSNRAELYGGPARGVTALVLDDLNTEASDQIVVKAQAMRFLRELAPVSRVAVYQVGREFRVLHDFTDDMELLRARLRNLKPAFASGRFSDVTAMADEAEAFLPVATNPAVADQIRTALLGELNYNASLRGTRVGTTVAALEAVARHLSGIAGRKSVVWIGGGIGLTAPQPSTNPSRRQPVNPTAGDNYSKLVREAARSLAQSGIVLYMVDARGLQPPADDLARQQYAPQPAGGRFGGMFGDIVSANAWNSDPRAAAALLAGTTGGRYLTNTNDFSEGVRRAVADTRGAYTVAFYAGDPADDRWHTVKISTSVPGVELTHRHGYLSSSGRAADWDGDRLRRQLLSPLGSSAIHLTARCAPAGDNLQLTMQIDVEDLSLAESEGRHRAELEVTVGEIGPAGSVHYGQQTIRLNLSAAQLAAALSKGIPYRRTWTPAKDTVTLRIVVRQKGMDRYGTLTINSPLGRTK